MAWGRGFGNPTRMQFRRGGRPLIPWFGRVQRARRMVLAGRVGVERAAYVWRVSPTAVRRALEVGAGEGGGYGFGGGWRGRRRWFR